MVGGGAAVLGSVVGIVSIAGFLGSQSWLFDLTANFRPQQALLLLPLGTMTLFGFPRLGTALLVVGVVDAALVAPYLVGSGAEIAGDERIEVMTFNVGVSNPNRSAVAEYIALEDPDVVFIFESSFEWEDTLRAADLPLQMAEQLR